MDLPVSAVREVDGTSCSQGQYVSVSCDHTPTNPGKSHSVDRTLTVLVSWFHFIKLTLFSCLSVLRYFWYICPKLQILLGGRKTSQNLRFLSLIAFRNFYMYSDNKEGVCSISAIFLFKHSLRFSVSENELKVIRRTIFKEYECFSSASQYMHTCQSETPTSPRSPIITFTHMKQICYCMKTFRFNEPKICRTDETSWKQWSRVSMSKLSVSCL